MHLHCIPHGCHGKDVWVPLLLPHHSHSHSSQVDTVTANKLRDLARAKDLAVANEDYDEAKRLKASIDRLKASFRF